MIIRAALSLGLVWLSLPHHPDLGLSMPAPGLCDVAALCAGAPASMIEREAIFSRLRQVRAELRGGGKAKSYLQATEGEKTWKKI